MRSYAKNIKNITAGIILGLNYPIIGHTVSTDIVNFETDKSENFRELKNVLKECSLTRIQAINNFISSEGAPDLPMCQQNYNLTRKIWEFLASTAQNPQEKNICDNALSSMENEGPKSIYTEIKSYDDFEGQQILILEKLFNSFQPSAKGLMQRFKTLLQNNDQALEEKGNLDRQTEIDYLKQYAILYNELINVL